MFRTEQARREKIAAEVRAEMARQRTTAITLSGSSGISPAALSRKLNGKSGFTVDELLRVSDVLGVEMAQLLPAATDRAAAS